MYLEEYIIIGIISGLLGHLFTRNCINYTTKISIIITIILTTIEFWYWNILPKWHYIVLSYSCAVAVQYFTVKLLDNLKE